MQSSVADSGYDPGPAMTISSHGSYPYEDIQMTGNYILCHTDIWHMDTISCHVDICHMDMTYGYLSYVCHMDICHVDTAQAPPLLGRRRGPGGGLAQPLTDTQPASMNFSQEAGTLLWGWAAAH